MHSEELEGWRRQIDRLDSELVALLARRREISKKIMGWKKEKGLPFLDEDREKELLERLSEIAKSFDLDAHWVKELYQLILKNSKTQE